MKNVPWAMNVMYGMGLVFSLAFFLGSNTREEEEKKVKGIKFFMEFIKQYFIISPRLGKKVKDCYCKKKLMNYVRKENKYIF